MMDKLQVIQGLIDFLGVAAIVWFFYGPWQHLVVDLIRQQLFELRDGAFEGAISGDYAFDSKQYIVFRGFINASIRSASHATVWRFLVGWALRRKVKGATSKMTIYLSGSESIEPLKTKFDKACVWIMLLLWLRSPVVIFASIILAYIAPFLVLLVLVSSHVNRLPRFFGAAIRSQIQRDVAIELRQEEIDVCALS